MADLKPKERSRALYDLAVALGYGGRYDEAISKLTTASGVYYFDEIAVETEKIKQFRKDEERLRDQGVGK